jgi:hypothetical protein
MGLNLSNNQIAKELDLNQDDVQRMTGQLRSGIVENKTEVQLSGAVECDEVSVIAGHKGSPEVVKKSGCNRAVGEDVSLDGLLSVRCTKRTKRTCPSLEGQARKRNTLIGETTNLWHDPAESLRTGNPSMKATQAEKRRSCNSNVA